MTHEEKLKEAKKLYESANADQRYVLERLFPELKESEDETIRKALIEMVHDTTGDELWVDYGIHKEETLAWLEKQGQQKYAENAEPKFKVGDTIKCKYDDRQFTIKSVNLDKGTYTYTQEGCGNDIDYADEEFELVEQTPTWSEEDEKKLNYLIALLQNSTMTNVALSATNEGIEDFLKSLKNRVQPQPQQEWSEEDEMMWSSVLQDLQNIKDNNPIVNIAPEFNWLKSLKERYTWKPSSEQIEAIRLARSFVVDDFSENPTLSDILVELEKQLKKL